MLKITFKKLTTKTLGDLATRVLAVLKLLVTGILANNPLVAELEEKNATYQQVVIKKVYSGMGPDVELLDLKRDNTIRGLKRLLKGFLKFTDSPKADDAKVLLAMLDEVGNIEKMSYADQNTAMRKLGEKAAAEDVQARIARLGLTDEAEAINAAQAEFEAAATAQTGENALLRQTASATAIRSELEDALRNIFALVTAMRNQPKWDNLYTELGELIKEAKQSNRDGKPKENEPI